MPAFLEDHAPGMAHHVHLGQGFFTDAHDLFIIGVTLTTLPETKGKSLEELNPEAPRHGNLVAAPA